MFRIRNRSQFLVNSEIHHINTRQQVNFHQPSVNVAKYQKGVYYLGILCASFWYKNLRNLKWFYKNFYMKNPCIPWMNILTFRNVKFTFGYTFTNLYYNLFVYYLKKVSIIICNAVNILNLFQLMPLFLLYFTMLTNLYCAETLNIVLSFVTDALFVMVLLLVFPK